MNKGIESKKAENHPFGVPFLFNKMGLRLEFRMIPKNALNCPKFQEQTLLRFNYKKMIIEKNSVVSLTYELRSPDANGEVVEISDKNHPLVFLFGTGGMLESFERHLAGLKKGDEFHFTLESHEAYGDIEADAVVDLPIENFMVDGKLPEDVLTPGKVLTMQDQDGYPLRGVVKSRSLETVKMDFNHPMAGKNLNFKGNILEIRKASAEELSHGHVHGPGGHHH